jgi:succinoglycan biosynthesis protein ExoH
MACRAAPARLLRWLRGDGRPLSDQQVSHAIGLARIALIVGLVFLHYHAYPNSTATPFDGLDPAHHPVATFVNSFVLFFFFSAVPLLSMISGWLFFSFLPEQAPQALSRRIRWRFRSLYLPLVLWNALFVALLWTLYRLSPGSELLVELDFRFGQASLLDYTNAVFGITQRPIGFQFWFVRDLFVTILVSPLLWWSLRRSPYIGMAVLGAAWLAGSGLLIFFRTDVVFFFYLGGFLRMREARLEIGRGATLVLLGLYLALVTVRALMPLWIEWEGSRPEWLTGATRAMRLVGVLACWGVIQQVAGTRAGVAVARYGGLAFFVFALHFPLIAQIKLWLWRWVPAETDAWMVAHYASSVVVTVAIGLAAGSLLARHAPRAFALMNGGRVLQGPSSPAAAASAVPTDRPHRRTEVGDP